MTRAGWDLVEAISAAMAVLGWFELPEEDVPPDTYWHSPELVEDWFKAVKRRHADRGSRFESIEDPEGEDVYVDEEVTALRG